MGTSEASPASDRSGDTVQSVKRALDILRILSYSSSSAGMRFSDLQAQSGLSKGTLHRFLKTLSAEGFVEQGAGSRVYYLGLEFLSMGERAAQRLDIQALARPSLERLAQVTGDTTMLTIRSGLDAVCIDRQTGTFPVKVLTQNVGTRRPLGVGSGSLALLAAFDDAEVENVLRRNAGRLEVYPSLSVDKLRTLVQQTRQRGYALNTGHLLKGMYGVGVSIYLAHQPVAALSIAAHYGRMDPERRKFIFAELKREAEKITRELGD
jgi:DNA-binding IclR family transcriptional regulator